jgi:Protein of unknown function (DUF2933)
MQTLVYLACPLMMLFCMRGMIRPRKRDDTDPARLAHDDDAAPMPSPVAGRALSRKQELVALRTEQAALARRIDRLAAQDEDQDDVPASRQAAG